MSALNAAEARASSAIERLELALRANPTRLVFGDASLERDCEILRQECAALRRELTAANERLDRLAVLVTEVEGRVDSAIHRVDELAGTNVAA
jgi:hypothetical protein